MIKQTLSLITSSCFLITSINISSNITAQASPKISKATVNTVIQFGKKYKDELLTITATAAAKATFSYISKKYYQYEGKEYSVCQKLDKNKHPIASKYFCNS